MMASTANAAAGLMEDVAIAEKGFELGKSLEGVGGIGGGGADTCSSEMHFIPIQAPSPLSLVFQSGRPLHRKMPFVRRVGQVLWALLAYLGVIQQKQPPSLISARTSMSGVSSTNRT